ncbi:type VII secretion target [Lentzea kentuckyensis]|uniref:type VII secretion target n=1 Tax=Lentzea kentuckyensis TaxID=360086 RepID=UPI000A3AE68D|nr:type VII secretion target [Lentzea kentuckyensis]
MAGYEVLVDELEAHRRRLEALADRMREAVDAARQVSMTDDAYGVICQPFAMMLQPFEDKGVNALSSGAASLEDVAQGVRATAAAYSAQEDAEATRFRGNA